jgi:putative ABC transport system permease protein
VNKLILRGFAQRRLRALLTGIAVALGVALMAGTYILTDTIDHSFAGIFGSADANKSVVITEHEALGSESGSESSSLNDATIARVREVSGVAAVSGSIFSEASFLTTSGKRLTGGHAPSFVDGLQPSRFESFHTARGHMPAGADELAIDQATAEREHLELGQQIVVAGRAPAKRFTIVGIVKFASSNSFGGASVAVLIPAEAQRILGLHDEYDSINVAASNGVSPTELKKRLRAALPSTLVVRTGEQEAKQQTSELEKDLGFLRTFLLVFAYVALVVGAFIIFNTFSITVAQRTREFGLLRTLGASRQQILRSVMIEGLLLGLLGAVAGLFIGIGLAPALDQLFKAFGADLPDSGTVVEARTVIVSLVVGTVVTLLAGFFPAWRATRVPPIAAMREGVSIPPRPLPSRRRMIARTVGFLIAAFVIGKATGGKTVLPVLLAIWVIRLVMLGLRLRRAGKPRRHPIISGLGRALGVVVIWRGITGRLARENSIRQPGRTLVTALALTIGLGLVVFISVLADGTKATVRQAVSKSFAGNLIVLNSQSEGEGGIPASVAPAMRKISGVGTVTAIAFTEGRIRKASSHKAIEGKTAISAVEPESFGKLYKLEWEHGSPATLASLSAGGAIATKKFAEKHELKVGEKLVVETPSSRTVDLTVEGIVKEENSLLLAPLTVTSSVAKSQFGVRQVGVDFLTYASGARPHAVRSAVDALLRKDYPQAHSRTAAEFTKEEEGQVNSALTLIYVLLALSVIVSLFGIVNTLVLSIYERTQELGMMRAIGTSRRQIRQMIRYESVITGLIGGILGLVIGVLAAMIVVVAFLSGSGYVFALPVGTLIIALVISGLAGLLAAQLPARRAARLDVLGALSSE